MGKLINANSVFVPFSNLLIRSHVSLPDRSFIEICQVSSTPPATLACWRLIMAHMKGRRDALWHPQAARATSRKPKPVSENAVSLGLDSLSMRRAFFFFPGCLLFCETQQTDAGFVLRLSRFWEQQKLLGEAPPSGRIHRLRNNIKIRRCMQAIHVGVKNTLAHCMVFDQLYLCRSSRWGPRSKPPTHTCSLVVACKVTGAIIVGDGRAVWSYPVLRFWRLLWWIFKHVQFLTLDMSRQTCSAVALKLPATTFKFVSGSELR